MQLSLLSNEDSCVGTDFILPIHIIDTQQDITRKNLMKLTRKSADSLTPEKNIKHPRCCFYELTTASHTLIKQHSEIILDHLHSRQRVEKTM
jgi:hypothetical protein